MKLVFRCVFLYHDIYRENMHYQTCTRCQYLQCIIFLISFVWRTTVNAPQSGSCCTCVTQIYLNVSWMSFFIIVQRSLIIFLTRSQLFLNFFSRLYLYTIVFTLFGGSQPPSNFWIILHFNFSWWKHAIDKLTCTL